MSGQGTCTHTWISDSLCQSLKSMFKVSEVKSVCSKSLPIIAVRNTPKTVIVAWFKKTGIYLGHKALYVALHYNKCCVLTWVNQYFDLCEQVTCDLAAFPLLLTLSSCLFDNRYAKKKSDTTCSKSAIRMLKQSYMSLL